jgi:hypothetical protein
VPLHVARRDIVEHQRDVGQMTLRQYRFDSLLSHQQPVERGIEFVVIDVAETERFAEAGGCGGGREGAGGGELGDRIEDTADQHRQHEVAAAIAVGAEDAVEADLARGAKGSGDVAVRQAAGDGEGIVVGGNDGAAFEHATQTFDMRSGSVGEVAQGALMNLAIFPVALAQQNGRR